MSYDNNGNLVSYGTSTYIWDYHNRITQAGTGLATSTYSYDYMGSRVSQIVSGVTTMYANKMYSTNSASTTKHIFAGNDLVAVVERTSATTTHIIHTDHLGGTNVVTDANGDVMQTLDYYPYGALRLDQKNGDFDEKKKFIGEHYDTEVALSYLNARYYDGGRGQFLSEDPVFLSQKMNLQNPQSLNSYSYAENNSINKKDPQGLASYIWANGAGMTGVDTWNTGTYYQTTDNLMMNMNAVYAQNNHLGSSPQGYLQFKSLVQKGGRWDYLTKETKDPNGRGYYFSGNQLMSVENFGNAHYGYVGTAGGFPSLVLDIGGGYAQLTAGDYKLSWVGSFFDDPGDQSYINYGISSYNQSLVSAVNDFSSANIETRASAVNTFNSGVGATTNESKLWTTPNGSVITWDGTVVSPGVK